MSAPTVECWCCGSVQDEAKVVRLGNHPEVALCVGCARWAGLQGRAIEDRSRTGPAVRANDALRAARRTVIQRGWHRLPVVGAALRKLGRHTP